MKSIIFLILVGVVLFSGNALAEYDDELRRQAEVLERRYASALEHNYFYDMGIIARKADEGQYDALTSEIVGTYLFKKMDLHVNSELEEIERLYRQDSFKASRRLEDLVRYKRYYQPTGEYLSTTGGQAFGGELARMRANSIEMIGEQCPSSAFEQGLKAMKKTGVFITGKPQEIKTMRELQQKIDCCIRWKSKIHFFEEKEFETDYESGKIHEKGALRLKSSPRNLSEAIWEGKWIYRITGREGTAEGVSLAKLVYRKGEDIAQLTISTSRVNSAGRINLPIAMSGDRRTLDVDGNSLYPELIFSSALSVPLVGCNENKVEGA